MQNIPNRKTVQNAKEYQQYDQIIVNNNYKIVSICKLNASFYYAYLRLLKIGIT